MEPLTEAKEWTRVPWRIGVAPDRHAYVYARTGATRDEDRLVCATVSAEIAAHIAAAHNSIIRAKK